MLYHAPDFGERILRLLKEHGWAKTLETLRGEIAATKDVQRRNNLRFFTAWMAAERGVFPVAEELVGEAEDSAEAKDWASIIRAFMASRERQHEEVHRLLDGVSTSSDDPFLQAVTHHLRASNWHHAGDSRQAVHHLGRALELIGPDHFLTGRILDTYGMTFADGDNFHAAELFYREALAFKVRWGDELGQALTYGNLGRLYLDWGSLDKADDCFRKDREIAERVRDAAGVAKMYNHLGQVATVRGRLAQAEGKARDAGRHWDDGAKWLDQSIAANAEGGWPIPEGFARKDRAMLHMLRGEFDAAADQLARAEARFLDKAFDEGLAHLRRIRGMILHRRGNPAEAIRELQAALDHFASNGEPAEVARTRWEIARARHAAAEGNPGPLARDEYLAALRAAELCRRPLLVEGIERELKEHWPETYHEHVFGRVRGRGMPPETHSLTHVARRDTKISVLFLDLKGSTIYGRETDPETILTTLNQMMADMSAILRAQGAVISGFRGDGFMAMFWDEAHSRRAVEAAVAICEQMDDFNAPRRILGLRPFVIRIGVSTGAAVLGNMGTYDMMDFTAIGATVNLGARLEAAARVIRKTNASHPCICPATHADVGDRFVYRKGNPRIAKLKGFGPHEVWDVVGRNDAKA